MSYKALVTVGACAVAGLAFFGFGQTYRRRRKMHFDFTGSVESLFV